MTIILLIANGVSLIYYNTCISDMGQINQFLKHKHFRKHKCQPKHKSSYSINML